MARVLVVEDEAACRQLLQRILRHDCDVCVAGSIREALDLLEAGERYELILYDINLPRWNDVDLRHEIQDRFPELLGRFAYIVGDSDEADGMPALEKPLSVGMVRRFVWRMLYTSLRS